MADVTGTVVCETAVDAYQRLVVSVFADVLGEDEEDVPSHVPFAQLGGSSLDASLVCARLAARLGRDVPASGMARRPTASAVAAWLRELEQETPPEVDPTEVQPDGASAPGAALALAPEPCAFLMRQLTEPADRSAYCLMVWSVDGRFDQDAFDAALADVHGWHEALNSVYQLADEPVAIPRRAPAPRTVALGVRPGAETAEAAVRAELEAELDLEQGPVWRAAVAEVSGGTTWVLGLVVHHLAFDGWSEAVLADGLSQAYCARLDGRAPEATAVPGLAAQWSARSRRLARAVSQGLPERRAATLAGTPDLPWGSPPEHAAVARPGPSRREHPLSADDLALVDKLAAAHGVTRFAVLLAVYGAALAEVTGMTEFGVGVPVAGRADPLTQHSVGCFVGTVCVRLTTRPVDGALPPDAVLGAAEAAADAFAAQDVPLAELVRVVNPERRQGRSPLVQNIFALQDTPAPLLHLTGAETVYLRQPYADLPVELLTEVRPDQDGGAVLVTSHRPGAVPDGLPDALAGACLRIVASLRTVTTPTAQEFA